MTHSLNQPIRAGVLITWLCVYQVHNTVVQYKSTFANVPATCTYIYTIKMAKHSETPRFLADSDKALTVSVFNGATRIHIRKFFVDANGTRRPSRSGITLNRPEFVAMIHLSADVLADFDRLSPAVPCPDVTNADCVPSFSQAEGPETDVPRSTSIDVSKPENSFGDGLYPTFADLANPDDTLSYKPPTYSPVYHDETDFMSGNTFAEWYPPHFCAPPCPNKRPKDLDDSRQPKKARTNKPRVSWV